MTAGDRARTPGAVGPHEWEPWLAFVEETLREAGTPVWENALPALVTTRQPGAPLLAGAEVRLARGAVVPMLRRLRGLCSPPTAPALARLDAVLDDDEEACTLLAGSLEGEIGAITSIAERHGIDREALESVASLLSVPFLQACRRRWEDRLGENWEQGYCPLCGSWPAFAEVLGVEHCRRFRCGRCGAAWPARLLRCAFCANTDYAQFDRLIPQAGSRRDDQDDGSQGAVDACTRCLGYVKTIASLQACPPLEVMLRDLATVALDFAALERGYARPNRVGYPLGLRVTVS